MLRVAAAHARRALAQQVATKAPVLSHGFASAAAEEEQAVIHPPVRLYGTSGRYATALYTAAVREKVLDAVSEELEAVVSSIKESPTMAGFLMDPTIPKLTKADALISTLKEGKYSVQTVNFMGCLAENGRLDELYKVASDFKVLVRAEKGQVAAKITTAMELKPNQVQQVREAVGGMLKPGQSLEIELNVDPTILGGLIVSIDDKRIDLSVATRVRKMNLAIKDAFS